MEVIALILYVITVRISNSTRFFDISYVLFNVLHKTINCCFDKKYETT